MFCHNHSYDAFMQALIQSCTPILNHFKLKTAVFAASLLWFLFLFLSGATAVAQEQPMRYEDYLALIGQTRGEVINAQSQGVNCNSRLLSLSNQLNNVTQILMPDGSVVQINHTQAGLPSSFSFCDSTNFVRFLNGVCPENVCLTTGVVLLPNEPQVSNGGETAVTDLVDFINSSEILPELAPPELPEELSGELAPELAPELGNEVEEVIVEGATGEDVTSEVAIGEGVTSEEATGEEAIGEGASGEGVTGEEAIDEGVTGEEATSDGATGEGTTGEGTTGEGTTDEGTTDENDPLATQPADQTTESAIDDGGTLGTGENETAVVEPLPEQQRLPSWVIITLSLLLLIIIGLLVFYISRSQKPEPLRPETTKKVQENVESGRRLLSKGEYREAIHKLFNATLEILEDRGMIRFESSQTNYELLGAAGTAPLLVSQLAPVVDAYDRVWYGFEPLATAEFETLVTQLEQLKTLQRRRDRLDE